MEIVRKQNKNEKTDPQRKVIDNFEKKMKNILELKNFRKMTKK